MSDIPIEVSWEPYSALKRAGKLCFHYCSKQSRLPIRDVLNDHGKGRKKEPNYETATYNWCAECNQHSVRPAARDGLSHILFVTRYTGLNNDYCNRYFIVGYYEIGWKTIVRDRDEEHIAIRAKRMCFVPVEKAYEITDERWQRINISGRTKSLHNLRYATQRINNDAGSLDDILQHLDKHDATDDYLREVARLRAEYNPFKRIPTGRIFIINVGANANSPLQSPLFKDGTFELVPIPEHTPPDSNKFLTYDDLRQFYKSDQRLLELFPEASIAQEKVHDDPEFLTLTYGDNIGRKSNLRNLQAGDFLFFLARLVPYDGQRYDYSRAIFALVGYLQIAERIERPDESLLASPGFVRNAHVRRWRTDPSSFANFAIFKGTTNSRRFRYAVPFDREFVEIVPLLKADGSRWEWGRTTDLGVIGSYTRTVRMHIDLEASGDRERAERFWRHIWRSQR